MLEYFIEMKALWEELHSHRPLPNYACPYQCRCDAVRVPNQIIQFLTDLSEQFSVVKTQVLLMYLLPTLNKVFFLVLQEESSNASLPSIPSLVEDNVLVNAYDAKKPQGHGKGSFTKPSSRFCIF